MGFRVAEVSRDEVFSAPRSQVIVEHQELDQPPNPGVYYCMAWDAMASESKLPAAVELVRHLIERTERQDAEAPLVCQSVCSTGPEGQRRPTHFAHAFALACNDFARTIGFGLHFEFNDSDRTIIVDQQVMQRDISPYVRRGSNSEEIEEVIAHLKTKIDLLRGSAERSVSQPVPLLSDCAVRCESYATLLKPQLTIGFGGKIVAERHIETTLNFFV